MTGCVLMTVAAVLLWVLTGFVWSKDNSNKGAEIAAVSIVALALTIVTVFLWYSHGVGRVAHSMENLENQAVYETLSQVEDADGGVVAVLRASNGKLFAVKVKTAPPKVCKYTGKEDRPFEPYPPR